MFISIVTLLFTACTKKDVENTTTSRQLPVVQQPNQSNKSYAFRTYYLKHKTKSFNKAKSLKLNNIDSIQYVKFVSYYSEDDKQVNVHEIEAYSLGLNVALNQPAIASSVNPAGGGDIANINDGDYISRWSSNRNDTSKVQFIEIDLQKITSVDSIRLYLFQTGIGADTTVWRPWKQTFTLYVSKNLTDWDSIGGGINVNYLTW